MGTTERSPTKNHGARGAGAGARGGLARAGATTRPQLETTQHPLRARCHHCTSKYMY